MTQPAVDVEQVLDRAGLLRRGAALVLACTSPATGVLTWATGELAGGRVVTAGTPMYAASVTKQVVAVLAAQQVLAGHLDPEASIVDLLPGLPGWARAIRVRHLVHHTSGLPATSRVLTAVGLHAEAQLDNAQVLRGLRRLPAPDRPPGQAFAYSNTGYVVLAEVVRVLAGAALPDLARTSLFAPLAMTASHLSTGAERAVPMAARPPRTIGDGGLWTSATDLLTWLDALDHDRLGADLTRLVQTSGHLDDGTPVDHAWGVTARPDPTGTTYTHGGDWPGWSAKTLRRPVTGTAVALLSTSDDAAAVSRAATAVHEQLTAEQ